MSCCAGVYESEQESAMPKYVRRRIINTLRQTQKEKVGKNSNERKKETDRNSDSGIQVMEWEWERKRERESAYYHSSTTNECVRCEWMLGIFYNVIKVIQRRFCNFSNLNRATAVAYSNLTFPSNIFSSPFKQK